jgi:hypothetical protein
MSGKRVNQALADQLVLTAVYNGYAVVRSS